MPYAKYDYTGDISYFQNQLTAAGISKTQLNMDNYAGLTAGELQNIVKAAKLSKKRQTTTKTSIACL